MAEKFVTFGHHFLKEKGVDTEWLDSTGEGCIVDTDTKYEKCTEYYGVSYKSLWDFDWYMTERIMEYLRYFRPICQEEDVCEKIDIVLQKLGESTKFFEDGWMDCSTEVFSERAKVELDKQAEAYKLLGDILPKLKLNQS